MAENSVLTHRNVGLVTVAAVEAPDVVTSEWIDEQLARSESVPAFNPVRS